MLWIVAITSMCVVLIAHHLGFIGKAYAVIGEIARCSMCSVFWCTALVLWYYGASAFEIIALSFVVAYLSNWVAILLDVLSKSNDRLWQKSRALWRKKR
jgi:hypothetical protein